MKPINEQPRPKGRGILKQRKLIASNTNQQYFATNKTVTLWLK